MKRISGDIAKYMEKLNFSIVSTIGNKGTPHSSCKGIVKVDRRGMVYLLDLYTGATYRNLLENPRMNVTGVDEHRFTGYCLRGKGRIIPLPDIPGAIMSEWEKKMRGRITQRIIRSVQGQKGHPLHPEAQLPPPKYLIVMTVEDIIDLAPAHVRRV